MRERIEKVLGGESIIDFYIPRLSNQKGEEDEPLLDCVLILDSQHFGGLTFRKNKDIELSLFSPTDLVYLAFLYSRDTLEAHFGFLGFHEYVLVEELGREQEMLRFVGHVKELARTIWVVTHQAHNDQAETNKRKLKLLAGWLRQEGLDKLAETTWS